MRASELPSNLGGPLRVRISTKSASYGLDTVLCAAAETGMIDADEHVHLSKTWPDSDFGRANPSPSPREWAGVLSDYTRFRDSVRRRKRG